jgi:hypothetical protein
MGEFLKENISRDWESDPKKLGDPIKPIEVSSAFIPYSILTLQDGLQLH